MTANRIHQTRKVPAVRAMQPPARPGQARRMAGVTLVELVITLSIAAILMTIAVPSFQDLMRSNRASAQANDFLTALLLARSEAVTRGASVSVCSSANPSSDSPTCRTTDVGNWADGWILYVTDTNPLEVLRVWPAISSTATFTATGTDAGRVTFRGTGQAAAEITFTYTPTGCSGDQKRTIKVTAIGRATATKTTCGG